MEATVRVRAHNDLSGFSSLYLPIVSNNLFASNLFAPDATSLKWQCALRSANCRCWGGPAGSRAMLCHREISPPIELEGE